MFCFKDIHELFRNSHIQNFELFSNTLIRSPVDTHFTFVGSYKFYYKYLIVEVDILKSLQPKVNEVIYIQGKRMCIFSQCLIRILFLINLTVFSQLTSVFPPSLLQNHGNTYIYHVRNCWFAQYRLRPNSQPPRATVIFPCTL